MSNSAHSELDFTSKSADSEFNFMSNSADNDLDFTTESTFTQTSFSDSLCDDEETQVPIHTVATQTELCSSYTNGLERKYECHVCNQKFSCGSNKMRHIQRRHPEHYSKPIEKVKMYSCKLCQKSFSSTRTLMRHLKKLHNICRKKEIRNIAKNYKCDICYQSYVSRSTLRRHIKHMHDKEIPPKIVGCFKCSECSSIFQTKTSYFDHIITIHGIAVNVEILQFENAANFASWKSDMEKETVSYFSVQKRSKRNGSVYTSYICHRSGYFVSKNTGKRRLKSGGSNKIECFCPASISVQGTSAGKAFPAEVKFTSLHLGHACEIGKLRIKQRERCRQETNDIVSGLANKLEEFSSQDQCTEIDRAIAMLTAMKNKKINNVPNTSIEPQKKVTKRQKKDSTPNGIDVL